MDTTELFRRKVKETQKQTQESLQTESNENDLAEMTELREIVHIFRFIITLE